MGACSYDVGGAAKPAALWVRNWAVALRNSFFIAATTLWAHKLRSVLTVFGIVIGIASVVLIGTTLDVVGETAAKSTAQTIGADTFTISQVASAGSLSRKELSDKLRKNPEIYRREAEALAIRIRDTAISAPVLDAIADVKSGNKTFLAASITGSNANIQIIRAIKLSSGRFFSEMENRHSIRVAVIGQDLVKELASSSDPLGKSIRIKGQRFRVIGVQEKQGASFGSSLDRKVYIPLLTFEKIWGSRRSVTVYVRPHDPSILADAQEQGRFALRQIRRLRPRAPDNFDLLAPEAGRSFLERLVGIISVAIIPITSVALIVAGIVVMNMMLVSVTERTRETGIRKSFGARNRDILTEILFESIILTLVGGVTGLFLSYLGTLALSRIFDSSVRISAKYVLMALATASAIGAGAGFYPAYLASRMPPVEALRYET
jgi:putative ABC transport system permease protein